MDKSSLETPADLLARVQLVETNAQLVLAELRETRRMSEQTAATLSLVLSLLANTREADGGYVIGRLFQDLLHCAESPELAAQIAACEAESIDPHMLRATAALLTGDMATVLRHSLGEAGRAH